MLGKGIIDFPIITVRGTDAEKRLHARNTAAYAHEQLDEAARQCRRPLD